MNKISGRPGVRVDNELVLDAAGCEVSVGVLEKYKRLRAVEVALCGRLHDMVTDAALNFVARSLGLRERGEALYEHADYSVLLELATYHHRLRGKTVIERFVEKTQPAVGTDEHLVLAAMISSRFTLLRLGETEPGVGVRVEDLLFGGDFFLADLQLHTKPELGFLGGMTWPGRTIIMVSYWRSMEQLMS
jgi:hypothetical protein